MSSALLVLCANVLSAAHPASLARLHAPGVLRGLPLRFEPNVGQADARARFLARGAGPDVLLTEEAEAVLRDGSALRLLGARRRPRVSGEGVLPGRSHYFLGRDPSAWRTDVPQYAAVRYAAVYPGIDLVFHGVPGRLEYDFELASGADPARIRMGVRGARRAAIEDGGSLVLEGAAGRLVQPPPVAYQEAGGRRDPVEVQYALRGRTLRFMLGPYDRSRPLVIDPILSYSSYFGGNLDDAASDAGYDRDGNIVIVGHTDSGAFPLMNPLQPSLGGQVDAFVAKLNPETST